MVENIVNFNVCNLESVENYVNLSYMMNLPEKSNILDVIADFDRKYQEKINKDDLDHSKDFWSKKIKSLLQLLWNPDTEEFYEDVGVEVRDAPPDSNLIPVAMDWKSLIPNKSWIVLTPDAGC